MTSCNNLAITWNRYQLSSLVTMQEKAKGQLSSEINGNKTPKRLDYNKKPIFFLFRYFSSKLMINAKYIRRNNGDRRCKIYQKKAFTWWYKKKGSRDNVIVDKDIKNGVYMWFRDHMD